MGPTGFRYASIYARLISHIFLGFSGPTTHLTKTRSGFKKVNVKIGDHQTFSSSSMPTIIFVATIGNIYSRFGHYSRSVLKIFQNNTIKTFIPSRIFPLLLCKPTVCSSIGDWVICFFLIIDVGLSLLSFHQTSEFSFFFANMIDCQNRAIMAINGSDQTSQLLLANVLSNKFNILMILSEILLSEQTA